jgi:hypothetical protein
MYFGQVSEIDSESFKIRRLCLTFYDGSGKRAGDTKCLIGTFDREPKGSNARVFHWIFKHFLSFFIYWSKYSLSCSIAIQAWRSMFRRQLWGFLVRFHRKSGWSLFLICTGQGYRIRLVFAWNNEKRRRHLARCPGCELGAVSAGSLLRDDIQWIVLHYAAMHCPGQCITLWVILFGNVK